MPFTTTISTEALAAHLADTNIIVVDCRFDLKDPAWGESQHALAHVPGAAYAHLDRELSGPKTGRNGRHPLPEPDELARTFACLGIDHTVQVVAYDQDAGAYASRLWWLLRWLGHDRVAVLDGGWKKWTAEGRPAASGAERRAARPFVGTPRPEMLMTTEQVAARQGDPAWCLLDARAPERYRGEIDPIDRVPGHIPGAINRPYLENLTEQSTLRPADDLRALFTQAMGAVTSTRVICYCGSGVTACESLLALEHAGLPGAALYAGSWSEWSSDPSRPVEKG